MALTASAVFECWPNGLDASAGGFDPGVAGFPTDGTTDANTGNTASPVFSSASYNFVAGDVGHWIYIKSGTSSIPGWYKIASVASNKATLNATIGAAVLAAGSPTTAAGIATIGTPTTLTWGIDYSQSATAKIAFTDMVIDGTTNTKFTSVANPVGKNMIGNIINVISGTGFTVQRVVIVSTVTTTATCDKSLGTLSSTGGTGNLGGAFLSPALPFSVAINSNMVFIKTGAYTLSNGSTNVAGGILSITQGTIRVEGYGTVRGDLGTPPALTASGISSVALVATSGSAASLRNFTVDGASLSTVRGFTLASCNGYLLTAKNCTNNGFNCSNAVIMKCVATGCSTQAAVQTPIIAIQCEAYSNTVSGFVMPSAGTAWGCLSYNNSGASSDGFSSANSQVAFQNCSAYNNGRDGFRSTISNVMAVNCVSESNTGQGFNFTGSVNFLINCAAYLNGTNFTNSGLNAISIGSITGTASFFVNPGAGNFALNANSGGGASVRAAAIPGLTPDGLSTGYLDVGAIQSPPVWPPARAFTAGGMN